MTQLGDAPVARPVHRPRTEVELHAEQLLAIDRFVAARQALLAAGAGTPLSREQRLDLSRQQDVLRREHQALVAQAHRQLQESGAPLVQPALRRVVVAHRSAWFTSRLTDALRARHLQVRGAVTNGADAVGAVVAEQPDAVLVEDTLEMVTGERAIRDLRTFCSRTLVVGQVAHGDRVGALLEAGASMVFTREVPPAEVAQRIAEALPPG